MPWELFISTSKMPEFDFNPRGTERLFNPSAAFGVQRPYLDAKPSYKGVKPADANQTGFTPKLPYPTVGIDFATGKTIDLQNFFQAPEYKADLGKNTPALSPDWREKVAAEVELASALQPLYLERAKAAAKMQAELSDEQIRQLYPLLSAAQQQSVALNLGASKAFRAFKEQMPSSVQDIMASKQNQMYTAATGEAERQRATAAQQEAAKRFAGSFSGQYIQVA